VPQTLLLADDSVTIQRVIELTFAEEDIDVVAVSDGDQAIARLDAMPPDIVLVDVGMPGRSGYDVASHVKHTPHLSHIPVVLLTGAFEPVDEVKANAVGCDGILAKPFEPQMIISRVKELLARPESEKDSEKESSSDRGAAEPSQAVGLAMFAPEMTDAAPASPAAPAIPEAPAVPAAAIPATPASPAAPEIPPAPPANPEVTARLDEYFDQLESAFARLTKAQAPTPADPAPAVAAAPAPADLDWFGPRRAEPAAFEASLTLHPTPSPSGLSIPDSAELFGDTHAAAPSVTADRMAAVVAANPVATLEPVAVSAPIAVPAAMTAVATAVPDLMLVPEPVAAPVAAPVPEPAAYTQVTTPDEPVAQRAIAAGEPLAAAPAAPRDLPQPADAFAATVAVETAEPVLPSSSSASAPTAPVITDDVIDRVSRRVIEQLSDRVVREAVAEAVSGIAERLVREEIDRIKASIKD
jgi:CheY-like chemotaxis protein